MLRSNPLGTRILQGLSVKEQTMSRDKQNIKTTDWLTRGMTEEEIAKAYSKRGIRKMQKAEKKSRLFGKKDKED